MQVQVEKTEPCKAHVQITVPPEEYAQEVRRLLAEVGRGTRLKGFRPGKVPPEVIERMHGKEVRREARQRFVQRGYEQALSEHELRPFSQPEIDAGDQDPAEGAEFSVEFDLTLRPQIELADYKGLEIETSLVPVTDEEVEAAIEQVRKNQARPEPAGEEGLPADGMALCTVELLHEGEVVFSREGLRLGPTSSVPGVAPEAFEQALTGRKDGEVAEVPLVFPSDFEVEAARGHDGVCRVTVQQAFRIVEPTLEEMLAQLELADEEALRARVREKLDEANRTQEQQRVEGALLDRVIDAHEVELPSDIVEQQVAARLEQLREQLRSQGVPEDQLDAEVAKQEAETAKAAERSTRAFFLVEAIAQAEKLEVGQEDLRAELASIAQRNQASVEEVAGYYREQKLFGQLGMEIMERKVRSFLREQADLKSPQA